MGRKADPPVIRGMKKIREFFDDASESTIRRWEKGGLPLYRNPRLMAIREELFEWARRHRKRVKTT